MPKQRVSLVLGSGGARGLAHIGAIRCLEDNDYEIAYISGSSIGALIGGIYAAGDLDGYANWVVELSRRDVVRLLDLSFGRGAIFSGDRIITVLRKMFGESQIEDLDIGFTAVATDINEGREVWLNQGPLYDAIRASIAMPLIFEPVDLKDMVLVDGGLINPVPIAPTLNAHSDLTIAIDLNGPAEKLSEQTGNEKETDESAGAQDIRQRIASFIDDLIPGKTNDGSAPRGAIDLALRSIDTMQTAIARMQLAVYNADLTIRTPANLCTFLEFHRGKELIEFGYRRTEEALTRLQGD